MADVEYAEVKCGGRIVGYALVRGEAAIGPPSLASTFLARVRDASSRAHREDYKARRAAERELEKRKRSSGRLRCQVPSIFRRVVELM